MSSPCNEPDIASALCQSPAEVATYATRAHDRYPHSLSLRTRLNGWGGVAGNMWRASSMKSQGLTKPRFTTGACHEQPRQKPSRRANCLDIPAAYAQDEIEAQPQSGPADRNNPLPSYLPRRPSA